MQESKMLNVYDSLVLNPSTGMTLHGRMVQGGHKVTITPTYSLSRPSQHLTS